MKIIFSVLLIFCFKSSSICQNISYGIVGGVNGSNSNISVNHNGEISSRDYYDNRISFYLGGNMQIPLKINKFDFF